MNTEQKMDSKLSSLRAGIRRLSIGVLAALALSGSIQAATDEVVYFHTDALGSPVAAFNEAGEVCWAETYAPYGEKLDKEDGLAPAEGCGLLGTDVGYTGHVQDDSGLVYAQQRYYDPVIGRFMSTDPVMPNSGDPRYFGRYHYAANNPYAYTDPTGKSISDGLGQTGWEAFEWATGYGDGEYNDSAVLSAYASGYNLDNGALGLASAISEDLLSVLTLGEYAAAKAAVTSSVGVSRSIAASSPNQIGKAGEDAVNAAFDIGRKQKFAINGRNRIPDGVTATTLSEVKNVKSLSYTKQLRDFADIAQQQGLKFDLYVRPSTSLSGPLSRQIASGKINPKLIPGTE